MAVNTGKERRPTGKSNREGIQERYPPESQQRRNETKMEPN